MNKFYRLDEIDDRYIMQECSDLSENEVNELASFNIKVDSLGDIGYYKIDNDSINLNKKISNYLIDFVKTQDDYFYLSVRVGNFLGSLIEFMYGMRIDNDSYNFYKCDQIEGLIECIKMLQNKDV